MRENVKLGNSHAVERNRTENSDVRACAATKDQMWVRVPTTAGVCVDIPWSYYPQGHTMSHYLGTHLSQSWFLRAQLIPGSCGNTWDTVLVYVWFHCPTATKFCDYVSLCYHQRITKFLRSGLPCWCPTSTLPLGSYRSEWHLMPFRFIRISGNTLKLRAISRSMVLLKLRSVLLSALNVTTSP